MLDPIYSGTSVCYCSISYGNAQVWTSICVGIRTISSIPAIANVPRSQMCLTLKERKLQILESHLPPRLYLVCELWKCVHKIADNRRHYVHWIKPSIFPVVSRCLLFICCWRCRWRRLTPWMVFTVPRHWSICPISTNVAFLSGCSWQSGNATCRWVECKHF